MKLKYKIIIVITCVIILVGLLLGVHYYINSHDNLKFKYDYESYNNIEYSNGKTINIKINKNNKIKYLDSSEIMDVLNSDSAVIYFGYATCPWCRNVAPILIDTANIYEDITTIYYVDTNKSFDIYKEEIYNYLDFYLNEDEDGNKHLSVPDVFFIKDGQVIYHHLSTVSSYTNPYKGMDDTEIKELSSYYQEGFDLLLGDD